MQGDFELIYDEEAKKDQHITRSSKSKGKKINVLWR